MSDYKIDLNNPDYAKIVLSYSLWGQANPPAPEEITNEKWIDRKDVITLEIDPQQFKDKYSHLFNAKDFGITEVFFSGETKDGKDVNINPTFRS